MSGRPTPLVDFDGTLVSVVLDWEQARDEADRRGLPRRIREAVALDADGAFRSWLDDFESSAELVPLHLPLHAYLQHSTWAIVTNNGSPVVDRAVEEGLVPRPTVVVARGSLPLKPAPDMLLAAVAELAHHVEPHPLYIGDSAIDRAAADAAHVPFLPIEAVARG
ncbi:MAG: Haloacid dehalogenase-like hydrolase [Acidimicrobiaceae bacterium]|jgi:HAD superfamily hydrolase (TIGR01549 family)